MVSALVLAMAMLLQGCGSSSMISMSNKGSSSSAASISPTSGGGFANRVEISSDSGMEVVGESPDMAMPAATDTAAPVSEPRKLVKNGDLQLETKEFDTAVTQILALVEQMGGYIDSQTVDGKSLHDTSRYFSRSASMTARVPADKLDSITAELGSLCNIVSQSQSISDITDSYYDASTRLDTLKIKAERLQELLEKAEKLEDIISLESALSDCQYQIDSLTGQLRRMDNQVSYSTLYISLNEVVEYQEPTAAPKNFGERLMDSLSRSGRRLTNGLEDILLTVIESGPVTIVYLAFWGGILYLIIKVISLLRKRNRTKRSLGKAEAGKPEAPAETGGDSAAKD